MKKSLICLLIVSMILSVFVPAFAATDNGTVIASAEDDNGMDWTLTEYANEELVLSLKKGSKTVIPQTAYKIMGWKEYALKITKIEIAKEITQIKKQAFTGMTAVTAVELEEGSKLTLVGQGAFKGCTALKELHFGDKLEEIGQNAFSGCTALEVLDFGRGSENGVTFGKAACQYCSSLKTLVMPKNIKSVTDNTFNLIHGVESIYWYGTSLAEWDEMMLRSDFDPDYLADGDNDLYLFDEETGTFATTAVHAGMLEAGQGITAYRNSAYPDKALVLTGSGTMNTFATGADAPWSDTNTMAVETVVITETLTAISANAFADCAKIKSVVYVGTQAQWETLKKASGENNDNLFNAAVTFIKEGELSDGINYRLDTIEGTDDLELTISGTTDMEEVVPEKQPWFQVRHLITSIVIEEGVTTVGAKAFYRMRNVEKLSLPGTVAMIETYAFRYAAGLKEITIPEGVENIGFGAFSCCYNLETINLPTTLTSVDMKAFEYCVGLKNVNYAGYSYQWSEVLLDNSGNGNDYVVNAAFTYADAPGIMDYADAAASEHAELLQYLFERQLICAADEDSFGLSLLLTDEEVYTALYIWAGADNRYENAQQWATENDLLSGSYDLMTGDKMAQLLEKMAVHNGTTYEASVSGGEVLTREAGLVALAQFLKSDAGTADRYDRIVEMIKQGWTENRNTGDGKLYIITPNMYVNGLTKKVGDCTLIIFPDGQTMLIDAGVGETPTDESNPSTNDALIPFLKDIGLTELDYFVLTHGHSDHYGGAKGVFDYIATSGGTVKNYWYGCEENNRIAGDLKTYLQNLFGTTATMMELTEDGLDDLITLTIGGVRVDVFGPTKAVNDAALADWSTVPVNNSSICLKMTFGESVFLTCGDIYEVRENALVEIYGDWLRADVIKANHHGNYQSSGQAWVDRVQAKVYLAEIDGNGNAMVAARVKEANGEYYTTGYDGLMLVVMSNDGRYEMEIQYDGSLRKQTVALVELKTFTRTTVNADGSVTVTEIDLTAGEGSAEIEPNECRWGSWQANGETGHIRYCECGKSQTADHSFDAGTVTVEPTTTTEGTKVYTCTECGFEKTDILEKLEDITPPAEPAEPTTPATEPTAPADATENTESSSYVWLVCVIVVLVVAVAAAVILKKRSSHK